MTNKNNPSSLIKQNRVTPVDQTIPKKTGLIQSAKTAKIAENQKIRLPERLLRPLKIKTRPSSCLEQLRKS